MKVRVYYDGYNDVYLPQFRSFGIWRSFEQLDGRFVVFVTVRCPSKNDAIDFLNNQKARRKADKESEAAAKERSKKSGVVYEDVI